ncbi:unnamed protein product [Vitrella brassicaformis CCMP3155]|uniref:Mechanosensitive ion channel MscS domain-containing protein n=2 Tax=Vitrella brassicaformis TaxID=1169539 RepID=A0A0G4EVB0_VITBC|nr:unnamed protein product [Vitrella brassicaformis CCMP3155]|eukprot:CEM02556.1 unnamed protein product [Vitrella brassicaformis CCMP3155]
MAKAFDSDEVLENVSKPFIDRDPQKEWERVRVLRQITRHLAEGTSTRPFPPDTDTELERRTSTSSTTGKPGTRNKTRNGTRPGTPKGTPNTPNAQQRPQNLAPPTLSEPVKRPSPPPSPAPHTPTNGTDPTGAAAGGQEAEEKDTPTADMVEKHVSNGLTSLQITSPSFGIGTAAEFASEREQQNTSRVGFLNADNDNLDDSVSQQGDDMLDNGTDVNKSRSYGGGGGGGGANGLVSRGVTGVFTVGWGSFMNIKRQGTGNSKFPGGATDRVTDMELMEEEEDFDNEEEGSFERNRRIKRTTNCLKRCLSVCKMPNLCTFVWYLFGVVALFVMGWVLENSEKTMQSPSSQWLFLFAAILVARMVSFIGFDANLPSSLIIETLHEHCARVLWFSLSLVAYAVMFSCKTFTSNCQKRDDGQMGNIEQNVRRGLRAVLLSLFIMSLLSIVRELVMTWVSIQSNGTRNRQLQLLVWKERAFSRLNRVAPELHLHLGYYDFTNRHKKLTSEALKRLPTRHVAARRHGTGWTSRVPASAAVVNEMPAVGSSAGSSIGGELGIGLSGPAPTAWESWRHRSYVILHPIRFHLRGVGRVEITRKREVREYGNQLFTQLLEVQAKLVEEGRITMESFAILRRYPSNMPPVLHEGEDGFVPQPVSYNFFGRELIRHYIPNPEDAERLLLLLDPSGTGRVTRSRFLSALLAAYNERKQLLKSLEVDESVADIVKSLLWMLQWCIIIITVLWLLGVNPYTTILGFASIFAGVAFALGNSIKNFVDSLVFVFIQHPFDIGDRVSVDGDVAMYVRRISVMTTTFETIHNKQLVLPNFQLAVAKIINESKSPPAVFEILFQLSTKTSMEQFMDLRRAVIEYCCRNPRDWISSPPPDLYVYSIQPNHSMEVGLWVTHMLNWAEHRDIYPARTKLFWHLMQTMDRLGMEYYLPIQPLMTVSPPKTAPDGEGIDPRQSRVASTSFTINTSLSPNPSPDMQNLIPSPSVRPFFLPGSQQQDDNRNTVGSKKAD